VFAIERTSTGTSTITGRSSATASITALDCLWRLSERYGPRRLPSVRSAKMRDPGEDKLTLQSSFR
jgi:hypothetical protein